MTAPLVVDLGGLSVAGGVVRDGHVYRLASSLVGFRDLRVLGLAGQELDLEPLDPGALDLEHAEPHVVVLDLVVRGRSVWVASNLDDTIVQLDVKTGKTVGEPIPVGRNPFAIAAHGKTLWVTNLASASVTRIDVG